MTISYLIQINEAQRIALLRLLKENLPTPLIAQPDNIDPTTGEHPLEYWIEMITDLPKVEAESPECIHGFCL